MQLPVATTMVCCVNFRSQATNNDDDDYDNDDEQEQELFKVTDPEEINWR